jgi:hypothetical protein
MSNQSIGDVIFEQVCEQFKWYRTVREFVKAGDCDFTFLVTKKGVTEEDNLRIESVLQDLAEREYGDRKYAFITKIYAGKDASRVLLFVPPPFYDEVKRLRGRSGSLKRLKALMTKLFVKEVKPRK